MDRLADAAYDAARTDLAPLLEQVQDGRLELHEALAEALRCGIRIGAVEATARMVEMGYDVGAPRLLEPR